MILGADIGGTKTLLAASADGVPLLTRRYANDDYAGFDALLGAFLGELRATHRDAVTHACLAVAGPVRADEASLTNRVGWRFEAATLAGRHGFGRVSLVNDFAAVAAALPGLRPEETVCLQAGSPDSGGTRLALGPGTGLGVAALAGGQVIASEGGHLAFAPWDEETLGLWRFLGGGTRRVIQEQVVSGRGITACWRYLLGQETGRDEPGVTPAEVSSRAMEDGEPLARRALALFARCYGAIAGDLALAFLARGGVYLAGGITPRVLPALQEGGFLTAFNAKAEHSTLAATLPVHAVLATDLGLRGALAIAAG
jgi:glucokinase